MNSFLEKFVIGEWNIGICNQDFLQELEKTPQGGIICLRPMWMKHRHINSFYADPFIYEVNDDVVKVLAEEFFYDRSKGVISLLQIDRQSAKLISKNIVLEEDCHLSYPFYDREYNSIIPESYRNETLSEYSLTESTTSLKKTLTDFPLIDATPIEHQGKWYLFATVQPNALDELVIYWSENREGPYKPHAMNPVRKDIKTSRCGGKLFEYKGQLFRPVQDSTNRYGETMHIMKVNELSPHSYSEELYCDIKIANPGKYSLGFHTLNFQDGMIVVDGFRETFRLICAIYVKKIAPLLR